RSSKPCPTRWSRTCSSRACLTGREAGCRMRLTLSRERSDTHKRRSIQGGIMNSSRRIAAVAGLSCAIAGFATAAEPDRSENPWSHWYIGSGIGPGFGAKYKVNGRWISFDDELQTATDRTSLVALNIVNAGIALTVDYSRQSYGGSSTKPDSSQFGAAYLGYMYRR